MIEGIVSDREAIIRLRVYGLEDEPEEEGKPIELEAVIDTGFDRSLTLSPDLIAALGLTLEGTRRVIFADGREDSADVYSARVEWEGEQRFVFVEEADTVPLVGMELLAGFRLRIDCVEDGRVEITKLPETA